MWEENKEIMEEEVGEALGEGVGIGIWHVRKCWDLSFYRVEISFSYFLFLFLFSCWFIFLYSIFRTKARGTRSHCHTAGHIRWHGHKSHDA